ncbi:flavodoxin domain-containing protein [Fictibacillus nanhaiensis]|uniref:flavodoxin family protein n=1 Tax=Fictibacillus nanhaiensis TaxID=742169 RepID=UPI002E217677|nr:flavodoxin domain-containing protein [Fictibacillus nanhaiensis]MED1863383.1 flavodoxin domain-containing protein [Fictibacillus nanhaiensis]
MTSKALVYYSLSGNTKGLIDTYKWDGFDVYNIKQSKTIPFNVYETIIIGTSTWGNGVPPKPFFEIRDELISLKEKEIGLFGSGNSHYEHYCGALDLLEQLLGINNKIIFKYKFESYPTEVAISKFKRIMEVVI